MNQLQLLHMRALADGGVSAGVRITQDDRLKL